MIITLTQTDVEKALVNYVQSFMGRTIETAKINIIAGRGENGVTANVEIDFVDDSAKVVNTPIPRQVSPTPSVPEAVEPKTPNLGDMIIDSSKEVVGKEEEADLGNIWDS